MTSFPKIVKSIFKSLNRSDYPVLRGCLKRKITQGQGSVVLGLDIATRLFIKIVLLILRPSGFVGKALLHWQPQLEGGYR